MFRIGKVEGRRRTVVKMYGQLAADCTLALEICFDQALTRRLHGGRAGRAPLRRLAAKGIRPVAKGVYDAHLIRQFTEFAGERR